MDALRDIRRMVTDGRAETAGVLLRDLIRMEQLDPQAFAAAGRIARRLAQGKAAQLRVAVLGQVTTSGLIEALSANALGDDSVVAFYEGAFDNVLQELTGGDLSEFAPSVVVLLPWWERSPSQTAPSADHLAAELALWQQCWDNISHRLRARIVQVGYDWVHPGAAGYHLAGQPDGVIGLVRKANKRIREELPSGAYFVDLPAVAGDMGRRFFYEPRRWYWGRQPWSDEGAMWLSQHLWAGIRATLAGPRKALLLDLDNTLWGGVVGDCGALGVDLGGSPEGQAYVALQAHAKDLMSRGTLLGVVSKNEVRDAMAPFLEHPEMLLKPSDLAVFEASWEPKSAALARCAERLRLGADSFVFVDDSPFERDEVRKGQPSVSVPELPDDPTETVRRLVNGLWFERLPTTEEDLGRAASYTAEAARSSMQARFASTEDYLRSLGMQGDPRSIDDADMPRVVQLLAKTNQFNLTNRRHSESEVRALLQVPRSIGLSLRLSDRFGDYGLIALILAHPGDPPNDRVLFVDSLLMSCRTIGRTVEQFLWAEVLDRSRALDYVEIRTSYRPSARNALVRNLYDRLGLEFLREEEDGTRWYRCLLDAAGPQQTEVSKKAPP